MEIDTIVALSGRALYEPNTTDSGIRNSQCMKCVGTALPAFTTIFLFERRIENANPDAERKFKRAEEAGNAG